MTIKPYSLHPSGHRPMPSMPNANEGTRGPYRFDQICWYRDEYETCKQLTTRILRTHCISNSPPNYVDAYMTVHHPHHSQIVHGMEANTNEDTLDR